MANAAFPANRSNFYYASLQDPGSFAPPQTAGRQLAPMLDIPDALQERATLPSLQMQPFVNSLQFYAEMERALRERISVLKERISMPEGRSHQLAPMLNTPPDLQGRVTLPLMQIPPFVAPPYSLPRSEQALRDRIAVEDEQTVDCVHANTVEEQDAAVPLDAAQTAMPSSSPSHSLPQEVENPSDLPRDLARRQVRAKRVAATRLRNYPKRYRVMGPKEYEQAERAKAGSREQFKAARLHISQSQYKEAVEALNRVYSYLSDSKEGFVYRLLRTLGTILDDSEDWVASTEEKDMDVLILRGICCIKYGNQHEARRVLQIVLNHRPDEALARFMMDYVCPDNRLVERNSSLNSGQPLRSNHANASAAADLS